MKTFLQLTKEECLDVYSEVQTNAETLFSSARILAEHGHYGNAIGLLVLGSEEYIKSFLLFLEGYGFDLFQLKEIQAVFSKHGTRPQILRNSYSIWMVLKHVLDRLLPSNGGSTETIPSDVRLFTSGNNFAWWAKADHLKTKGLYSDYLGRLICPSNLTQNDYQNAAAKTQNIPFDVSRYTKHIRALNRHELNDLVYEIETSKLADMIEQSIKRKTRKPNTQQ